MSRMKHFTPPNRCGIWAAAFCLAIAGQAASAQGWQSHTSDSGSLIFGNAHLPDYMLEIGCTAPSPQGLSLFETMSHESHRTEAFEYYIGFSDRFFDWGPTYTQTGVRLRIGGADYPVPPFQLDELVGTAVMLPMTGPVYSALQGATSLAVINPQGVEHPVAMAGFGPAMASAMQVCVDRWVQMGHSVPAGVTQAWATAETPAAPIAGIPRFFLPVGSVRTPPIGRLPQAVPPMPSGAEIKTPVQTAPAPVQAATSIATLPPVIPQHVQQMCGGAARIEDSALQHPGDLDGDGVADYVIHYTDVYCQPDNMRGFCGAANCSIEVFLSTRAYANPFELLGLSVTPMRAVSGRTGLQLSATRFICADGYCEGLWLWDGDTFQHQPQ